MAPTARGIPCDNTFSRVFLAIDNCCYWVMDAIYREDHNPTRDRAAARNLAPLLRIALNTHNLVRP